MYQKHWPLSAIAAALGLPISIKINVIHDAAANVYVATSDDLQGLVVEASTFEELQQEVQALVPELLALEHGSLHSKRVTDLAFVQHVPAS
jgi:predicted RNase H-like HicB family nuclease